MSLEAQQLDRGPFFRAALALLAFAIIAGSALDLAFARHWQSLEQAIAWGGIGLALAALALLRIRPTSRRVWASRVLAALVVIVALVGMWRHVVANYEAAPLDFRYETRWAQMSPMQQWWAASTGAVGPAPSLAPAVLAQAAVCVLLASVGVRTESEANSRPSGGV